jgi:hypothetical protein
MKEILDYNSIVFQIKQLLVKSRSAIAHEINSAHVKTYWEIGRIIVEYEQKAISRLNTGKSCFQKHQNGYPAN